MFPPFKTRIAIFKRTLAWQLLIAIRQMLIGVLPFSNMTADARQEFMVDGLTETIIAALARVPQLFVIARNSTFAYKEKGVKVQQAAEELGVQYVLEGSLQRSGDKLRITAQFVDAVKGRHIWAAHYDLDISRMIPIIIQSQFCLYGYGLGLLLFLYLLVLRATIKVKIVGHAEIKKDSEEQNVGRADFEVVLLGRTVLVLDTTERFDNMALGEENMVLNKQVIIKHLRDHLTMLTHIIGERSVKRPDNLEKTAIHPGSV